MPTEPKFFIDSTNQLSKETESYVYNIDSQGFYEIPDDRLEIEDMLNMYKNDGKVKQAIDLPVNVALSMIKDYTVAGDEKAEQFIKTYVMKQLRYKRILRNVLSARYTGVSVSVVEPVIYDGYVAINGIYTLDPTIYYEGGLGKEKIKINKSGLAPGKDLIDRRNCIVYTHDATFEEPYGNSILRYIKKCYDDKNEVRQAWKLFLRKFGLPFIIGWTIPGDTTKMDFFNNLKSLSYGGTAVIPRKTNKSDQIDREIEFKETTKGTGDFEQFMATMDRDMLISMGISPLIFQAESGKGTYSLGAIHLKIFYMTVKECQEAIQNIFCGSIAKPLLRANFGIETSGSLIFKQMEGREFLEEAKAYATLVDSAIMATNDTQILSNLGLKLPNGTWEENLQSQKEVTK